MLSGPDVPAKTPRSLLFLCGMNSVRSPVAEMLARQILPAATYVASAGVRTGERDPFVDSVLTELGLSLNDRQPRTIDDLGDAYFELVITLAPEAHHAALEFTRSTAVEVEYWPTADQTTAVGTRDQIMAAYRDMRDRLKARILARFGS